MTKEKLLENKVSKWISTNRTKLKDHEGEYLALALDETDEVFILSHSFEPAEATSIARQSDYDWITYKVPWDVLSYHVYSIRVSKVDNHFWLPTINVNIFYINGKHKFEKVEMIVDSGADISVIPYKKGLELGFTYDPSEITEKIKGIAGIISSVRRKLKVEIEDHILEIPVVWILNEETDLLLGREVVFDKFDIEFKQADEQIILKYRDN